MRKINLKMNEFLSMPPQTNQIAEATRAAGASNVSALRQQGGGYSETGRKTHRTNQSLQQQRKKSCGDVTTTRKADVAELGSKTGEAEARMVQLVEREYTTSQ